MKLSNKCLRALWGFLCAASVVYGGVMRQPFDREHLILENAVVLDGRVVVSERPLASEVCQSDVNSVGGASFGHLFDGDYKTYWSPKSERGIVEVDLGQVEEISAIEWDGYTYGESFPSHFSVLFRERLDEEYQLGPAGVLLGASGSREFSQTDIAQNMDSHEVRMEFIQPIHARFVKFKVNRSSDGHPPRLTRLEILGNPRNETGRALATFKPYQVNQWNHIRFEGKNLSDPQIRMRTSSELSWSEWQVVSSEDLSFLNARNISEIQVSIAIENNTAGSGYIQAIEVDVDGQLVGVSQPLIPVNGSAVANTNPVLLWREGANVDYVSKQRYELQVSRSPDFEKNVGTESFQVETTEFELANLGLMVGDTVFWRVRSFSDSVENEAIWSEVSSFRISEIPRPVFDDSRFGMNMGLDVRPWGKEMAEKAGFSWSRLDFPWYKLQKGIDDWDWSRPDKEVQVARDLEISILGVLGYTPSFLSQKPEQRNSRTYPPVNIENWIAYVTHVATRYRADVAVWEVWNEHNHRSFFSGTPNEIAHLLKTAYISIKNISPHALVTYGGHAGFSSRYLDAVVQEVGAEYFDILNWHCYPGMPDTEYFKKYLKMTRDYREKLNSDMPIWLTEIGVSRNNKGNPGPKEIARRLVAHMAASCQHGPDGRSSIDKLFHFQFVEGHGYGFIQRYAMLIDYADPMVKPTPLPEFDAYTHALMVFDNAAWQASENLDGIVALRFALYDDSPFTQVAVVWRGDGINSSIAFEVDADSHVELRDAFGEVVEAGKDNWVLSNHDLFYIFSKGPIRILKVSEERVDDK